MQVLVGKSWKIMGKSWEIPKLNGRLNGKFIEMNDRFSSMPRLIAGAIK
jgi:hypothetical protein